MSPTDPKVAGAVRLRKRSFRDQDRRFLVEGAQGVREALSEDPPRLDALFTSDPLHELAVRASQLGVPVHRVGSATVARIASTVTPQDLVGVAPFLDVGLDALPGTGCLAVLHQVRDPGNAGTVLRSVDAAGAGGVVFTDQSVDVFNPKTVRASAGSLFHVPIVREADPDDTLRALRARGFRILAMAAEGAESLYATDLTGPIAFVFGNEAHGLPSAMRDRADAVVRVPIAGGAESLNLAAAATVCLFEGARRRLGRGQVLDAIVAAAAHDIRSPLTAMKGFGEALERRGDQMTPEQRALMVTGIVHDADRMDQIVRLLVDAARVASGALDLFPERLDAGEVVEAVARQQARDPDHPPIGWTGDRGPYLLDGPRLKTAILAFCEVLVWWGGEGPIRIRTEARGDRFRLEVRRTADPSVDQAVIDGLFLPRAPGTGGGSKVGPYVVRGVAEAQGGGAWARLDGEDLVLMLEIPDAASDGGSDEGDR